MNISYMMDQKMKRIDSNNNNNSNISNNNSNININNEATNDTNDTKKRDRNQPIITTE